MPDVTIHRCTLRVVRRGGWSWGPDPRGLARHAAHVLPELLEKALAEMFPDESGEEEDCEIAAPIRIRIPVRMSELAVGATSRYPWQPGATATASLKQRVESALRAALGLSVEPSMPPQTNGASYPISSRFAEEPPQNRSAEGTALPRLLLAWHEHGVLERRLVMLPLEQIETWHRRLWSDSQRPVSPQLDVALLAQIEDLVSACAVSSESAYRADILRRRILIAIEAAARLSLPATHPSLWRTLDRLLPLERLVVPPISIAAPAAVPLLGVDPVPPKRIATPPSTFASPIVAATVSAFGQSHDHWSVKVDCALPFLLLAPLARLGYLAALEAVLEATGMSADAPLFAAALAYKVLGPPQRGWQRSPAAMLAAAALAGSPNPISEDSLSSFARRIASHTAALDIVLADALIAGHTPGAPVILLPGFLTLDAEGCFPILWATDPAPILKRLASIVLIPPETADPALLRDLDAAGIVFVTEVRPTRNEHWQRIGGCWTNAIAPPTEPLRRAARALTSSSEDARAFAKELVTARPGIILASSPELERSLTLAASIALGMISWKLWRSRGRTTPQQVLERYADLEGRIRFDDESIHVNLPLGRRHQELRENGFLSTVAGIPWFGGRRVEFGGA